MLSNHIGHVDGRNYSPSLQYWNKVHFFIISKTIIIQMDHL